MYEEIQSIQWEDYLDVDKTFAVDAVVFSEEFRHSKFVSYKVKDAIVDYFREKTGKRPGVRVNKPDVLLNIHIAETKLYAVSRLQRRIAAPPRLSPGSSRGTTE